MSDEIYDDAELYERIEQLENQLDTNGPDADEILAAARGDYGDEARTEAFQFLGLELAEDDEYEEEEGDPETEAFVLQQAERLEQSLGRPLSNNEFGHVAQELLSGADPGQVMNGMQAALGSRSRDPHDSTELFREHFQDAQEEAAIEEARKSEAEAGGLFYDQDGDLAQLVEDGQNEDADQDEPTFAESQQ